MTDTDRLAALLAQIDGEWTRDSHAEGWYSFFAARLIAAGVTLAPAEGLRKALEDMLSMAVDGAARQHLDRSGIMQDPPHGMGRFRECEAPWCVRNQQRIAIAREYAALTPEDDR